MDDRQQQRINRAAQEFTDALVAAYRTASDNTVVAQQLGAQQIEYFFDTVIANLRAQAGGTSQMVRQLAGRQRLARETTRDLARASTDNYMDLLDSVFSFYQGRASRTRRRADEARGHIEEAETRAEQAESQTEEAKKSTSVAKRRATEAEKGPAKPKAGPRRPRNAPSRPRNNLGKRIGDSKRPRAGPRRPRENLGKCVGASKKPRGAPWKPRAGPRRPRGAKPKAGEATMGAALRPTPAATR